MKLIVAGSKIRQREARWKVGRDIDVEIFWYSRETTSQPTRSTEPHRNSCGQAEDGQSGGNLPNAFVAGM